MKQLAFFSYFERQVLTSLEPNEDIYFINIPSPPTRPNLSSSCFLFSPCQSQKQWHDPWLREPWFTERGYLKMWRMKCSSCCFSVGRRNIFLINLSLKYSIGYRQLSDSQQTSLLQVFITVELSVGSLHVFCFYPQLSRYINAQELRLNYKCRMLTWHPHYWPDIYAAVYYNTC